MSSGPDYKRIYGVTLLPSRIHCITAGSGHLDCIRRHQPPFKEVRRSGIRREACGTRYL